MPISFSIIIPTYNRAQSLKRAIDSIAYQTYPHWELIVVDDGSTDETEGVVKSYCYNQIHYIRNPKNSGVSFSRNVGVRNSNYSWLAFLDSDDEWLKDKLENQASYIEKNPEIKFVHCNEVWIRNGVRVNAKNKHKKYGGRIYTRCVPLCCVSPSASTLHKDIFEEFGGFEESFPACEDYDLWLKIFSKYEAGYIDKPLLNKYGGHQDQLSRKYVAMDYWRVKSLFSALKHLIHNLTHEEIDLTTQEIIKKSQILINGYKKHNNFEQFIEIKNILDKVLEEK